MCNLEIINQIAFLVAREIYSLGAGERKDVKFLSYTLK